MTDELRDPEFCNHDAHTMVFVGTEGPLCGDCHTPMVWVAVSALERMRAESIEQVRTIRTLRRQNERLRGVLSALQRSIEVIATTKVPQ